MTKIDSVNSYLRWSLGSDAFWWMMSFIPAGTVTVQGLQYYSLEWNTRYWFEDAMDNALVTAVLKNQYVQ